VATIPLSRPPRGDDGLDIVTICKADRWVDEILPRFAALIDANCSGTIRRHLLLLTDATSGADEGRMIESLLLANWHTVVCKPFEDPYPGRRLLAFDAFRSGLLEEFGLPEALYIDPDTDVIGDLQGIQRTAPEADLLWVANPLPLEPVLEDLRWYGFERAGAPEPPVLMEPGFFYIRRDLRSEFDAACAQYPDVHGFAAGSTYWNMVMRSLGAGAVRLPDDYNRTFWDLPAAVTCARSVHYTGQWKRLQPYLHYERADRRIVIHPVPVALPSTTAERHPSTLAVVALFRDNADYLPHAFSRFAAWERAGLPIRYYFLENDSSDATAGLLAEFMEGRRGRLESRRLAVRYERGRGRENHDRIMPLARMRNFIVDVAMKDPPQAADEWTLLLDSDIFFPADVLSRIFAARAGDPRPESIGMLTCYTQQLFQPDRIPRIASPALGMPGFAVCDHYFDTFAFQDIGHRHHHPFCGFARCRRCREDGTQQYPLPLVPADRPIVDVAAAFGGFALVTTQTLRDPRIRWTTYGSGCDQERVLAEHVVFCDRLRTVTGKRIVVLQSIDCVYRR